jgi:[phosphatase 2A protein]-leucine-carboxy methyltransferase
LESYIELDFDENVLKKAKAIRKSQELSAVLGAPEQIRLGEFQTCLELLHTRYLRANHNLANGGCELHAPKYHLLSADIRRPETLGKLLEPQPSNSTSLLNPGLPTLLIFECVLVYMTPEEADTILRRFTEYFGAAGTPLGAVVYEMFNLGDSFGRVMLNNLSVSAVRVRHRKRRQLTVFLLIQARGISLPGAVPYTSKDSLLSRFLRHDFTNAKAQTLRDVRYVHTGVEEAERYILRRYVYTVYLTHR